MEDDPFETLRSLCLTGDSEALHKHCIQWCREREIEEWYMGETDEYNCNFQNQQYVFYVVLYDIISLCDYKTLTLFSSFIELDKFYVVEYDAMMRDMRYEPLDVNDLYWRALEYFHIDGIKLCIDNTVMASKGLKIAITYITKKHCDDETFEQKQQVIEYLIDSDKNYSFDVECRNSYDISILYYATLSGSQEFLAYIVNYLRNVLADRP